MIKELEGQIGRLTAELDIDRVKQDLQNFTFNTMNERQEQIVNQLMMYMQKLMTQMNLQNQQKAPAEEKQINVLQELALGAKAQEELEQLRDRVSKHEADMESFMKDTREKLAASIKQAERPKINVNSLVKPKRDFHLINPLESNASLATAAGQDNNQGLEVSAALLKLFTELIDGLYFDMLVALDS